MADMENNFKELKDRSGILLGEAEHAVSSGTEGEKHSGAKGAEPACGTQRGAFIQKDKNTGNLF